MRGLPYEDWLIQSLKDRKEAAAHLGAAIEDGDPSKIMRQWADYPDKLKTGADVTPFRS